MEAATVSDLAASDLAQSLASLSFHETSWHLNIDVLSSIASALAKIEPRPVSSSSAAAFDPDAYAAEHRARVCAGARELAAMLQVCRTWRTAVRATDGAYLPLLHAAYPLLMDLPTTLTLRKPCVPFRRLYEAMQQVDQLRTAAQAPMPPPSPMSVLPPSPGASLADFLFTIYVVFQGWGSPPSEDEIYGEDRMRQLRAIGPKEAWVGTLSAANLGNRPDSEAPTFGLLQLDDAVCTVSVYVTIPPNGADDSSARTLTLYHEGGMEGCDEDCSDLYEYYAAQDLPYAHGAVGENLLDDCRQLGAPPFCIAPRVYTGSIALGLKYDDQLYEEECVRYLRGQPVTTFLVDRDLAARLDAENGPKLECQRGCNCRACCRGGVDVRARGRVG